MYRGITRYGKSQSEHCATNDNANLAAFHREVPAINDAEGQKQKQQGAADTNGKKNGFHEMQIFEAQHVNDILRSVCPHPLQGETEKYSKDDREYNIHDKFSSFSCRVILLPELLQQKLRGQTGIH